MRKPVAVLILAGVAAWIVVVNAEGPRIEIILDVSGSMRSSLGAEMKIDAAKSAIRETVSGIPDGSVVALRYYGHRVPQEQKDASCRDSELVVQFQAIDKPRFLTALDRAVPRGQTPIAYSLQQAAQDFGGASDEERALILVSDGIETCGGDPLATVRELAAKGFKVRVHTVGFDVDAAARAQLSAISSATGGEYFDARSASALADSLSKLTQRALLIDRNSAFGEAVRGGNTYAEAVAIKPGMTYHLDHHQRQNEYDYFAVDVRDGQKIVASIQSFDKGITVRGQQVQETIAGQWSGIAIHAPDQQKIVGQNTVGPGAKVSVAVPTAAGQGGRFYVLVGNVHSDQHQNSRFEVTLVDMFDANSGRDAGADDSKAVDVAPGAHTGFLAPNDDTDFYAIDVAPNGKYSVRVKPGHPEKRINLEVLDRDAVKVQSMRSPNAGAAVRVEDVEFAYRGKAFVKVSTYDSEESPYTLEITQVGGDVAPASQTPAAVPAPGTAAAPAPAPSAAESTAAATGTGPIVADGGIGPLTITLGLLGVGVLMAGAYVLGRRR